MSDIDFSEPQIVLLVGRPKRGKSNAIKYFILKNTVKKKLFKFGLTFTRTRFNKDYDYLPEDSVISGFQQDILESYIEHLEQIKEGGDDIPSNFIIFDDLIGLLSKNNPFLTNIFGTHRHFNTSIFLATQHLKTGANTTFREIVNHGVFFNSKNRNTIEALYEEFGQLFDNVNDFKEHFFKVTSEPFTAMLYNQDEDDVDHNYLQFKASDMSGVNIKLEFN